MNPRRGLQTRKNRRKRNVKWQNNRHRELAALFQSRLRGPICGGRQCGKSILAKAILGVKCDAQTFVNATGKNSGWVSADFSTAPEDELDLLRY